jgi:Arm DNA-binding domain
MARLAYRLTAVAVEALKDKGLYPDGDGLYRRVTSTGTKSWIYRYAQDGTTRDMGLGPLASVSLSKARRLAARGYHPPIVPTARRRGDRIGLATSVVAQRGETSAVQRVRLITGVWEALP